ncbi:MAG: hypothetical protein MMC33_007230 [Icmadophila ericetorum]|nr:hypothetical protein [Icmadophila ericetorum]
MEQPDFVPFIDFSTAYNQSSQIESFFPFDAESGRQVFANDGHSDIISNNYPEYWGGLTSVHQQQIPTEFPDTYDPENKFSQLSGMDQSMGLLPSTSYIQLENQMVRPEYPNSWWLTDVTQPPPVHSAQSTMANEFDKPQVHPGSLYCETPLGDRKTLFLIAQSSLNGYCALSSNPSSVESSPTESIFDQAIGSRRSSYESVCQASNYTSLLYATNSMNYYFVV